MYSSVNKNVSYAKTLFILGFLTFLFALGCTLLGYLFMPFAAASYAALLMFENKSKRFVSYIVPVLIIVVNFLLNGFYSAEAVAYIAVGVLLYFLFVKEKTKNEAACWLTLLSIALISVSAVLFAFKANDSMSFVALRDYYVNLYSGLKAQFIEFITGLVTTDSEGLQFFAFTREYAEDLLHSLVALIPSLFVITAFLLSTLALKLFDVLRYKFIPEQNFSHNWILLPSKFVAVSYIVIAFLNLFTQNSFGIFASSVANIYNIFLVVFACVGVNVLYHILKIRRGAFFAIFLIIAAIVVLASTAVTLASYFGVYFSFFAKKSEIEGNRPQS